MSEPRIDPGALEAIERGECPDGGGPQCVCKKLGKPGECVALSSLPKCTTCDIDGRFRIGMFTDMCGDCFGTKVLDGRVWDAAGVASSRAQGRRAFKYGHREPPNMDERQKAAWRAGFAQALDEHEGQKS